VSAAYDGEKVTEVSITSEKGSPCLVRFSDKEVSLEIAAQATRVLTREEISALH
jgi:hypothetical protein